MAIVPWTARIDSIDPTGDLGLIVGVTYFAASDAALATPLFSRSFTFPIGVANPEVVRAIRASGVQARLAQDTAAGLQARVGQTVAIP